MFGQTGTGGGFGGFGANTNQQNTGTTPSVFGSGGGFGQPAQQQQQGTGTGAFDSPPPISLCVRVFPRAARMQGIWWRCATAIVSNLDNASNPLERRRRPTMVAATMMISLHFYWIGRSRSVRFFEPASNRRLT
jgi:hypothetical protein